jgi:hypothetical protein
MGGALLKTDGSVTRLLGGGVRGLWLVEGKAEGKVGDVEGA